MEIEKNAERNRVHMPQGKWFRFGYGIVLVLLIIYLGSLVDWIFRPIVVFVQTLFAPVIIAGILYYLFRPIVGLLSKKLNRGLSILILFLMIIGAFTAFSLIVGPELQRQFQSLYNNLPTLINQVRDTFIALQSNELFNRFQESETFQPEEMISRFVNSLNDIIGTIGANITGFIGALANFFIILVLVPFILFYLLKEGEKLPVQLLKLFNKKQQHEGRLILADMDKMLSSYIQGQIIVSFCVGILCYIAYLIIGLDYALILALVAMFTNVIPFVGPWIGTFPAVIVAFIDSPLTALIVVIVVVVIQQIESNLISPQVMGKKLAIHPITIIFILLVAGRFAGVVGMLLAVPTYAVGKVIVTHSYRLWKLRKQPVE